MSVQGLRAPLDAGRRRATRSRAPSFRLSTCTAICGTSRRAGSISMVAEMDALNLQAIVNLSGGSGERLRGGLAATRGRFPKRFVAFATPSYEGIDDPGYAERTADQFERDVTRPRRGRPQDLQEPRHVRAGPGRQPGAHRRPAARRAVAPRRRAARAGADPHRRAVAVLAAVGQASTSAGSSSTEFPDRRRDDPRFASFEETMGEQHAMFRKHPETTFIAAHLGWLGNDLGRLGKLLDELPNVNVELGAVLAELGRQPRTARDFIVRYQDRVMMGKDGPFEPTEYHVYFRVLETARRVLRLLPPAPRQLEDVRSRSTRRRAAQGVLRERAADRAGDRSQRLPRAVTAWPRS